MVLHKPKKRILLLYAWILSLSLLLAACQSTSLISLPPIGDFKVATGVYLDEHYIGDKQNAELIKILEDIALLGKVEPKDATLDPELRLSIQGVFPGKYGQKLDLETTLLAIKEAVPNSKLKTCWEEVTPSISWRSFSDRVPYRGSPERQELALAINVAWGDENVPGILDLLQSQNIKATWFLTGRWADNSPETAAMIAAAGHELANHGYSDPHMLLISDEEIREEIERTQTAIYGATGYEATLFSPPYLELDQRVVNIASSLGLATVMYQVDTADWLLPGPERIAERVIDGLVSGAIILCHPTEQTAAGLELIINKARQDGYRFVSVGQLLDERR